MPKYSDYRDWENYRQTELDEQVRLRKLGISTYDDIPLLPPEGITNWKEPKGTLK